METLTKTQKDTLIRATSGQFSFSKKQLPGETVLVLKLGYFYHPADSLHEYANKQLAAIQKAFPEAALVSKDDHYANWPGSSYYKVVIRLGAIFTP